MYLCPHKKFSFARPCLWSCRYISDFQKETQYWNLAVFLWKAETVLSHRTVCFHLTAKSQALALLGNSAWDWGSRCFLDSAASTILWTLSSWPPLASAELIYTADYLIFAWFAQVDSHNFYCPQPQERLSHCIHMQSVYRSPTSVQILNKVNIARGFFKFALCPSFQNLILEMALWASFDW